jgi:hypothetical protein
MNSMWYTRNLCLTERQWIQNFTDRCWRDKWSRFQEWGRNFEFVPLAWHCLCWVCLVGEELPGKSQYGDQPPTLFTWPCISLDFPISYNENHIPRKNIKDIMKIVTILLNTNLMDTFSDSSKQVLERCRCIGVKGAYLLGKLTSVLCIFLCIFSYWLSSGTLFLDLACTLWYG